MATLDNEDRDWFAAALDTLKTQFQNYINAKFEDVLVDIEALNLVSKCPVCQGTGEVNDPVEGEPGPPYDCPRCSASGKIKTAELD